MTRLGLRAQLGLLVKDRPRTGLALSKIALRPTYLIVADRIEREIMEGRLRPGDRLPTETALAEDLGVNRSTMREGLRLMEQAGLVERRSGRRLYVAVPGAARLGVPVCRALLLSSVTFEELYQLMLALEPRAALLAAERIDAAALGALDDNLARTEAAAARGDAVTAHDVEFHGLVAQAMGNPAWIVAREPAASLLYPASDPMMRRLPQATGRLIDAHRAIIAALREGNGKSAETWMRRHIEDFKRGYAMAGFSFDQRVTAPHEARAP
jgi:GntR family transcriptional repressor for pyruvate dehydrogenase complex